MAQSLGLILILGLIASRLSQKFKMPGLLGMLLVGVIIGPHGLNLLGSEMLNISGDLRKIALIIILLRAGFGINVEDLKKVGVTAIKMSSIPGIIEGLVIATLSMKLLNFSFIQGGILGFIISAVSPAVIVPSMLKLIENKVGSKKGIPTLILAGASIDDVVAITIFSAFLGLYSGNSLNIGVKLLSIPLSIILGVISGIVVGFLIVKLLSKYDIRDTKKVLIILGLAILLTELEVLLKEKIEIASLIGVMTIGFFIAQKYLGNSDILSAKLNKIWVFAEILLFVLVGAEVNISVALDAGKIGVIIILIGLLGRSIGVIISTVGTELNFKERIFCIISYTPKATVQAAIGSVPLSMGVESGDVILAISVLAILITAPLGAIGIEYSSKKLL